jgi:hypothetical protein
MKRLLPILIGIILVCDFGRSAAADQSVLADVPPFATTDPALTISQTPAGVTAMSLLEPQIVAVDTVVGVQRYQLFVMPGEPLSITPGLPQLPQVSRLYRIPDLGSAHVEITDAEWDEVSGVQVLPAQPDDGISHADFSRDAVVYNSDAWYPPDVVEVSAPMIFRDFRVVQITLHPVQVNSLTHHARVCRRLNVNLVSDDVPGENEIIHPRPPSRAFVPLYRGLISNMTESDLDGAPATPGSYLILCRNNTVPLQWADSLATWKRRLGYSVAVNSQAAWTYDQMRGAILTMYQNANPPLEFVCILGDPQGSYAMPTSTTDVTGNYDHYFASLTSDDIEDVGIGRLPVQSVQDFAVCYNKIIAYERNPYLADTTWFHKAFLYAGEGYGISSNEILWRWGRQQFINLTGVNNVYVATHGYNNVNTALVRSQVNSGLAYFLWRGTVVGEMEPNIVTGLTNGNRLPVVLTITCGTGDFNQGTCLSEAWMLSGTPSTLSGGVCGIATATVHTWVHFNNTVSGGFVYNICNLGVHHLGLALAGAKAQLGIAFPNDAGERKFVRWNNLMGEPSLALWTDQPVIMNAEFPAAVNIGARCVDVRVTNASSGAPIPDAQVVLMKGSESYTTATSDADGRVEVPITVNTTGALTLTVSKDNHKPYLANIACVSAAHMLAVTSTAFDDDDAGGTSGNGDGLVNPGETIDLNSYLRNFGTTSSPAGVRGRLSSTSPHVSIVRGESTYPAMLPGDSAAPIQPFRIYASPNVHEGEVLQFVLSAVSGNDSTRNDSTSSAFRYSCHAGQAAFQSFSVFGGDGDEVLAPAETVLVRATLRNVGEIPLYGVTATLLSKSPWVVVPRSTGSFGDISVQAVTNNAGSEFHVAARKIAYPGHRASMCLIVNSLSGYVDTLSFILPIGAQYSWDPTGPDDYGYYAYENADTGYAWAHPYHYVEISSVGTNLHIDDPGEQQPGAPVYSVLRNLPFPFTFYGRRYNQITVCSNGWAAFGDQHDQDQFRNYPIPGQQEPDAMIAAFWDDLKTYNGSSDLGVWDYFQADSHRYVIQWKAQNAYHAVNENFEILLLDPAFYPTEDGNGMVVVQYQNVQDDNGGSNDIPFATIGIQAPGGVVGLQYRWLNSGMNGTSPLASGLTVTFTTQARGAIGDVEGIVTDAATGSPLSQVAVSVDGRTSGSVTDANGHYRISDIPAGVYALRAQLHGYNASVADDVAIVMDSTLTLSFALLHPEMTLSAGAINVSLPQDPAHSAFDIRNQGNGSLDFDIAVSYAPTRSLDSRWDYLAEIDVSRATSDQVIQGCEFAWDNWWVSGTGGDHRMFYKFSRDGNYLGALPQPSDQGLGWLDMAWDGQLLYGSSGPTLEGINAQGIVQITIPLPVNPARAVAYDPATDHFWVADYYTDVYEITRDGSIVRHFANHHPVTGLAWNPSDEHGYRLYLFTRDANSDRALVYRMNPASGLQEYLADLGRVEGDRSGGCAVTPAWNSTLLVFAGILQGQSGDRLAVWELDFNTTWISVSPLQGTVPGGGTQTVQLMFDPSSLRDATYRVNLTVNNNTAAGPTVLPVTLAVRLGAGDRAALTYEYRLDQNYPNPFNSSTVLRYSLAKSGPVTLRVFNVLGQEVAEWNHTFENAGLHEMVYDFSRQPSGVYLYRIESGSFRDTKKLMLIR